MKCNNQNPIQNEENIKKHGDAAMCNINGSSDTSVFGV